ncbi:hypothetical protein M9M90_08335 [Phenylobacterium sp. LH3H17]|uniref:hypothetical protein n=1 Tax=Phenylobacterium sp. LH3H17 TaxID=2903901 RepID=UPI0020C98FFF|nr:hypothetical protein [Phenylobacterium sp. LH3H17]UTP41173.1 hypothetical protein M9M90_08335 [Phenylobacterium sp. LH3H17]
MNWISMVLGSTPGRFRMAIGEHAVFHVGGDLRPGRKAPSAPSDWLRLQEVMQTSGSGCRLSPIRMGEAAMSYIASENVRRFRALLETPLSLEKRKTIETLLAEEVAELERELRQKSDAAPRADF